MTIGNMIVDYDRPRWVNSQMKVHLSVQAIVGEKNRKNLFDAEKFMKDFLEQNFPEERVHFDRGIETSVPFFQKLTKGEDVHLPWEGEASYYCRFWFKNEKPLVALQEALKKRKNRL